MEKASHCIRPLRTAGSIIKYAKSHMHFYPVCLFFRHCNGKLAFGGFWCAVFVPLLVYLSAVRKLEKQGRTEEW